ncbi:MAG: SAM-dependent methyltransferase [Acidobacteria bacterium]|nr:MAG: SAM-dependent methyltransferase [Acidobacteriota bacterium]
MAVLDATQRFSSRVESYVRYRPGYPPEIVDLLQRECRLTPDSVIADIASGTGFLTRIFLANGNRVFGVEPNSEMRQAGERLLGEYTNFVSVDGTAEAITLDARSVDFVTAAQAAHWFDRDKARREFVRILKPAGWCALIWNDRRTDATFLRAYEQLLLTYGTDYKEVRHVGNDTAISIDSFFAPSTFKTQIFATRQEFDYDGLEGRLLSSSYTPQPGHPNYPPMLRELRNIFDAYQQKGLVTLHYDTRVYYGQLQAR